MWNEMTEAPAKVRDLEARVAALEGKILRAPGEACPKCGAYAFRVTKSSPHPTMGSLGAINRDMKCEDCGFKETKLVTPK